MFLSCPCCQARVEVVARSVPERVTCPSCGAGFQATTKPDASPTALAPDRVSVTRPEAIREKCTVPHRAGVQKIPTVLPVDQRPDAGKVPWYVLVIALVPLAIPAVAIPRHLLLGGALGGALWGGIGGGLAGICLTIGRRKNWTRLTRVLAASGVACLSLVILLGALLGDALLTRSRIGAPLHPAITVTAVYPGANAQVVADTVAAPIEQQVLGVENMIAMRSRCGNDGSYVLTLTFSHGTDLALAQVLVQNRVSLAQPILPELVKRAGITVEKRSANLLLLVSLFSPDGSRDMLFLSQYARRQLMGPLSRVRGVAEVAVLGQGDYDIRLWFQAQRLADRGLTVDDVRRALEGQKLAVAPDAKADARGADMHLHLQGLGQLNDFEQLQNIVLKVAADGRKIHLKDVAEIQLGQGAADCAALLHGEPVVLLAVYPTMQADPREVSAAVAETLQDLRGQLPAGVGTNLAFDFAPNLEAPGRDTTPEYLLLDLTLPAAASPERILAALKACQADVGAVEGVQDSLGLTDHPFDRIVGRPCVLVRLAPPGEREASRDQPVQSAPDGGNHRESGTGGFAGTGPHALRSALRTAPPRTRAAERSAAGLAAG